MENSYLIFLNNLRSIKILDQDPLRYILNNNLLNDTGLILEFGSWKGQTIDMISDFTDKSLYGFDTFEGLDYQWEEIDMKKFKLEKIPETVCKLDKFEQYKGTNNYTTFNKNVKFIKGLFSDTLPNFLDENNQPITFIHIDCDIYESTKTIFDLCNKRISNNCIIVFDDLVNQKGYEKHEIKAFYEWVKNNKIEYQWVGSGSKILNLDEIKLIDELEINKSLLKFDKFIRFNDSRDKILFNDKTKLFNLKCQVAVKIIKNPNFCLDL